MKRRNDTAGQLRKLIREAGMTQYRLSKKTGIPQSVLSRFMHKQISPNLATVEKIATALDCKIAILHTCPKGYTKPQ